MSSTSVSSGHTLQPSQSGATIFCEQIFKSYSVTYGNVTHGSTKGLMREVADALAARETDNTNLTSEKARSADIDKKKKAYADAYAAALPIMAICKTKVAASGEQNDGYGVIFFGSNDAMTLTKEGTDTWYTLGNTMSLADMADELGSNEQWTPVMISSDTLLSGVHYMFDDSDNQFALTNAVVTPFTNSTACPIMVMAKCGGLQTANVANNTFMRLSGDTFASHGSAQECISPISGTEKYRIGLRSEDYSEEASGNTPKKIWYTGSDMMRLSQTDGVYSELPTASMSNTDINAFIDATASLDDYNYDSIGRQPFVNGSYAYLRVTPNFFIRYPSENNGGGS